MQVTEILTDHTLMALELRGRRNTPFGFTWTSWTSLTGPASTGTGIRSWSSTSSPGAPWSTTWKTSTTPLTAGQGIFKNANILHMAQPASHTPDAEMFSVIMDAAFLAPPQSVIYQKYVAPFLGSQGLRSLCLSLRSPGSGKCWTCSASPTP